VAIFKLQHAYILAASDKVSGGKFQVKWDLICAQRTWDDMEFWTLTNPEEL
jgi:hypothetical protein